MNTKKMSEIRYIAIKDIEANRGQIDGLPKNPRTIKDARFKALKKSIEDAPEMLALRELLVYPHGNKFVVIGGNMRLKACKDLGYKELPCKVIDENTPVEKLREYTIKDNIGFGDDDWDLLKTEWDRLEVEDWGMIWQSEEEKVINNYSRKIEIPIYEPCEGADLCDCIDTIKYKKLIADIEKSEVSEEEKEFLRLSATRHIVFNYAKIGDYYAQASAEMQNLMENNALVIIDYDKAVERGFVNLTSRLIGIIDNPEEGEGNASRFSDDETNSDEE